jgi:hypothetical protein
MLDKRPMRLILAGLVVLGLASMLLGLSVALGFTAASAAQGDSTQASFSLSKALDYPPEFGAGVPVGERLTVALVFQNNSGQAKDVWVQDKNPRPQHLTILSDTVTGGAAYQAVFDAVIWNDVMEIGESVTVTFQMEVLDGAGEKVTNYAWLDDPETAIVPDAPAFADIQISPKAPSLKPIVNPDGDGDYTIEWTPVERVDTYTLQEDDNSSFSSPVTRYSGTATQFSTSRQQQGEWFFRVRASWAGSHSRWSEVESVTVVLDAPLLEPIDNGEGSRDYTIAWSSVAGATAYSLEVDDDPEFPSPAPQYSGESNQYEVTGQPAGTWYYRVRASNSMGRSSWSLPQSVTVQVVRPTVAYLALIVRNWPPVPLAPALNAISNPDGLGTYAVTWSNAERAEGYVLQEAINSSFSNAVQVYDGPLTNFTVSDRGPTRYYYRVKAYSSFGDSPWSVSHWTDVLWEKEPNDLAPSQANGPLLPNLVYRGRFPSPGDINDYFFFDMAGPGRIEVRLRNIPPGQNYDLVLRDNGLVAVGYSGSLGNADESILTGILPAGRYFVQVYNRGAGGSTQAYELVVVY